MNKLYKSGSRVIIIILLIAAISALLIFIDKPGSDKRPDILKLALIQYNDSPLSELSLEGILEGLKLAGMERERDFQLKVSNAQGDMATLNMIIESVSGERPDLIFVTSTPTLQAAAQKIKDIDVVFSVVADPVLAGAGESFHSHLPNITGISTLGDYSGMIELIREILPSVKRIGTIFSPAEANSVKNMNELKKFASEAGIELIVSPVNSVSDVADATLSLLSKRPDILCQIVDNLTSSSFSTIIKAADSKSIPVFGFVSDQTEMGAVLVVSRDYRQAGIDAVNLANRIFNGESTAEIAFEFVSKTDILINLRSAKKYGITIPEELLNRDNVIIYQ